MKNFKITQKELINLCLRSDYYFQLSTTYPDRCSSAVWKEIDNILNRKLSKSLIKRNLIDVEEIENYTSWKSINDVIEEKECTEIEAIDIVKSFLVCETLNNSYFEILHKKLINKDNDLCYVPESLSLGICIKWLATEENINEQKEFQLSKIKHDSRPLFTKEMMINFINLNSKMIVENLKELDDLKSGGNKAVWQVKANSLVQKVSSNDFRALNWKEIYSLIRGNSK